MTATLTEVIRRVKAEARHRIAEFGSEDIIASVNEQTGAIHFGKREFEVSDSLGWSAAAREGRLDALRSRAPAGHVHVVVCREPKSWDVLTIPYDTGNPKERR